MISSVQYALAVLRQEEGLGDGNPNTPGLEPYVCPSGFWTQGYGIVLRDPTSGRPLTAFKRHGFDAVCASKEFVEKTFPPISVNEAEDALYVHYVELEKRIVRQWKRFHESSLTAPRLAALGCLAWNIGFNALIKSSAWRAATIGAHHEVPDAIRKWRKGRDASGRLITLPGLIVRREIEARLYEWLPGAPFDPAAIRREFVAKARILAEKENAGTG